MRKKIIILFGPPGSGKGLLGDSMVEYAQIPKISTGDILRNEVKNQTDLGVKVAPLVNTGKLVDDSIVNPIVFGLLNLDFEYAILDGYPRCLSQFEALAEFVKTDFIVNTIFIPRSEQEILAKISQRRICADCGKVNLATQEKCATCGGELIIRHDDALIKARLQQYQELTKPLEPLISKICRYKFYVNTDIEEMSGAAKSILDFLGF